MAFRRRRKRRKGFINHQWGVSIATGHIVQLGGGGRKEKVGRMSNQRRRDGLGVALTCLCTFRNQ